MYTGLGSCYCDVSADSKLSLSVFVAAVMLNSKKIFNRNYISNRLKMTAGNLPKLLRGSETKFQAEFCSSIFKIYKFNVVFDFILNLRYISCHSRISDNGKIRSTYALDST